MKLHPIDRSFLQLHTRENPQSIAAVCLLDSPPESDLFRKRCAELANIFPRLSWRVEGSRWKTGGVFDPDAHSRVADLPPARSMSDIIPAVNVEMNRPLDITRPLWRFTALRSESGPSAAVLMIHHTLADGIGGMALVDAMSAEVLPGESTPLPPKMTFGAQGFLRLLGEMSRGRASLAQTNSTERAHHFFDVPLPELVSLKRELRTSMNDLFLGAVACVLKQFFPDLRPSILMPVNTRRRDSRLSLGNHLTAIGVPLPADDRDFYDNVRAVNKTTSMIKTSGAVQAYALVASIIARLPKRAQRTLSNYLAQRTTAICTNIPYSRRIRTLAGAKMRSVYGIPALLPGHALSFSFTTYGGKACLSVQTDPTLLPNGVEITQALRSYLEIRDAESEAGEIAANR